MQVLNPDKNSEENGAVVVTDDGDQTKKRKLEDDEEEEEETEVDSSSSGGHFIFVSVLFHLIKPDFVCVGDRMRSRMGQMTIQRKRRVTMQKCWRMNKRSRWGRRWWTKTSAWSS